MLAAQFLSARAKRTFLLLLAMLAAYAGLIPFASAQINTSINQSVWEMYYGLNPNQVTAAWLANQMPAGTNPLMPNSQLQVSTYSTAGSNVSLTFPTVTNKLYTMEVTSSLSSPITWTPVAGVSVAGNGSSKTLTAPKSDGTYFHIRVQDQSTANDGVSDWAKAILGYSLSTSISSQTSYTSATLATALTTQNTVTLNATDPTASQPAVGTTANNLGTITVSRAGYQLFNTITVPLQISGTAVPGTDYTALPSSVTFPAGINTIPLNITPLANAGQLSAITVIVTAQAGGGYALGTPSSASVLIYPNVVPSGTGLTGSYFAGSNTTYAATPNLGVAVATYSYLANPYRVLVTYSGSPTTLYGVGTAVNLQFLTGTLAPGGALDLNSTGVWNTNYTITINQAPPSGEFEVLGPTGGSNSGGQVLIYPFLAPTGTEVDPSVNFNWGTTTAPIAGIAAGSAFTVRWTGQVLATFTEPFWFSVAGTQGCKLWVNNQKIIDKWQTQALTDQVSTPINLQAGVFYDIKLEYLATAGNSNQVALQWFNADMPEQVIPQANLYPYITGFGASAAAAVTSPITAAYVLGSGTPFTYTITGSNNASGFSASNLPSWLTLSGNTLSGTPPAAGTYQFTITTTNGGGTSSAVVTLTVVDPPGTITREIWTGLAGANIFNIPTTTNPTTTDTSLTSLEDASSYGNNTGERLRGYFTAPTTANYYFWVGASNAAELWISDDYQKVNLIRRAYVTGPTGTASRTWSSQTNQQSPWLSLVAGQKYYFEVLHNTGSSGSSSNLSVAWVIDPTGSSGGIANNLGPAQPSVGGIVPATNLWPWDNPATTNTTGSIYLANLAPISGVTSPASGGAYLSVNGSTGLLHLNYSGLTSGTLWRRIYTGTGANQTLLFDLDAQAKNFPALETSDGGYTWTISNLSTLTGGLAYLTVATQNNPSGEISGSFALTSGSQTPPAAPSYPSYTDDHSTVAGASRFLTQATFGPSPTDIAYVQANGYDAWIENQFTVSTTLTEPYVLSHLSPDPQNPYASNLFFNAWWKTSITASDQLRQRVAFALSEIMVTSDNNSGINNLAEPEASYYDTLLNSAFTNYPTLLQNVTLSIAMGDYLNMLFNGPGNNQTGVHPNENYAREIMQLFSIGLYRLWPDGSLVLDDNGDPIPTYNQSVITGMAGVMTGWGWGQALQSNGRLPTGYGGTNWFDPMVLAPSQHQLTSKIVLDNAVLPAATVTTSSSTATVSPGYTIQYTDATLGPGHLDTATITNAYDANGLRDLQAALSMLSSHANIGPYICRQLIQRLVESSPSSAYVYRVTQAFNGQYIAYGPNAGQATGVVGDLKDTIRAILLDPEARNSSAAASSTMIGKQREPLLRITGPARTFPVTGIANSTYRELAGQPVLVTTPSAHRLVNGDVIQLDNAVDSGSYPPPSQAYSVANTTPTYTLVGSTGIATINAPGYQTNDTVNIQFTSGTLGTTSPYNTIRSYTVTSATSTSFTVNIGNTSLGNVSTSNAFTPNNFTINNAATVSGGYTNTSGAPTSVSISVSNSNGGFTAGSQVYLNFTTGTLAGGSFNGAYTVASATTSTITVTVPSATGPNTSQTVLYPELSGGYTAATSGGNSTLTFQTTGSNDLVVGDSVWLSILVPLSPSGATSGSYPVSATSATNASLQSNEFQVALTGTVLTAGTESTNGYVAFPLNINAWTRHGTATVDYQGFNMSYSAQFNQTPLDSPTVFNFFYPNYQYPGAMATAGMTVPEFELTNASNTMTLTNSITAGILNAGNTNGFTSFSAGGGGGGGVVTMDLGSYMTSAQTADSAIPTLISTLGTLLTGGTLKSGTATAIQTYVANDTNFPLSSPPTNVQMSNRVRAIVQLILISPEYSIQK